MDLTDPIVHAMIMDMLNNYSEPVMRRAKKKDFADATQTDPHNTKYIPDHQTIPSHREQAEFGERKRIKP
jgi:hypothetical protein